MPKLYLFIGQSERTYPDIMFGPEVLIAKPGDKYEFDEPPTDGLWIEAPAAVKPVKAARES